MSELKCPSCGEANLANLRIVNDAVVYWTISEVDGNTIVSRSAADIYDDTLANDRLECLECNEEFAVPQGMSLDWR